MNRQFVAIGLRALGIVLLLVAAYQFAVNLGSSLEIDDTAKNAGLAIDTDFAISRLTTIFGLVGLAMFWSSFAIRRP